MSLRGQGACPALGHAVIDALDCSRCVLLVAGPWSMNVCSAVQSLAEWMGVLNGGDGRVVGAEWNGNEDGDEEEECRAASRWVCEWGSEGGEEKGKEGQRQGTGTRCGLCISTLCPSHTHTHTHTTMIHTAAAKQPDRL